MAFPSITATQQFRLTLEPKTRQGKPAVVDGDPVWAASNEAVASVVPVPGTLSADVVAQAVGDYSISWSVDADLGEGVNTLTGNDNGSVTQAFAANINAVAGPVTEQP